MQLFSIGAPDNVLVMASDFGGVITSILAPSRDGVVDNICLGFEDLARYPIDSPYFGAIIGRVANRIANGAFNIDGTCFQLDINHGEHHIHGGRSGFHTRLWHASHRRESLTLTLLSEDSDQGYPGRLEVRALYEVREGGELHIEFEATTDKSCPINLTQHSYFNLAGRGDILRHELQLFSNWYAPVDQDLLPIGPLEHVVDTPFDFRLPRCIGSQIEDAHPQLTIAKGYDHYFMLDGPPGTLRLAARVREPVTGRVLELLTDAPGVQFYSGNFLSAGLRDGDRSFGPRTGFCLEPQHIPNAANCDQSGTCIVRPGEIYRSRMVYRISTDS